MNTETGGVTAKIIYVLMVVVAIAFMVGFVWGLVALIQPYNERWAQDRIFISVLLVTVLGVAIYSWLKHGRAGIVQKTIAENIHLESQSRKSSTENPLYAAVRLAWSQKKQGFRLDAIILTSATLFILLYFYVLEPLFRSHIPR